MAEWFSLYRNILQSRDMTSGSGNVQRVVNTTVFKQLSELLDHTKMRLSFFGERVELMDYAMLLSLLL